MLRTAEMVKLYCIFHKSYLEEVLSKLQNLGAVQFFDVRKKFRFLSTPEQAKQGVKELEKVEHFIVQIKPEKEVSLFEKIFGPKKVFIALAGGAVEENLRKIREELRIFEEKYLEMQFEREELLRGKAGIDVEISEEKIALLRQALISKIEESKLDYMKSLGREEEKISSKLSELNSKIERLEIDSYLELLAVREKLRNIIVKTEALANFGAMPHTFVLGCWAARENAERGYKSSG